MDQNTRNSLIWPEVEYPDFAEYVNTRMIRYIVVHCTGTFTTATVKSILNYWKRTLGWSNPGYHYLLDRTGRIHALQPEHKVANGVRGHNANAIHVSYIGGHSHDDRTDNQKTNLIYLLRKLKRKYPNAQIQGHRDFPGVAKACPQFDAIEEYKYI